MNDLIERLAREADFDVSGGRIICDGYNYTDEVERFAALVAQECANIAGGQLGGAWHAEGPHMPIVSHHPVAQAIRAAFPMPSTTEAPTSATTRAE
jgi:hypothetical protein